VLFVHVLTLDLLGGRGLGPDRFVHPVLGFCARCRVDVSGPLRLSAHPDGQDGGGT